jgi:uncharacterized membrane protein SirB2
MTRIILFFSALCFCTKARAVGDPAVLMSFVGEVLALVFATIYILTAKTQWKRKNKALFSIFLGGVGIFIAANISSYEEHAGWLDAASLIAVVISILFALFLLHPRQVSLPKERHSKEGQEY